MRPCHTNRRQCVRISRRRLPAVASCSGQSTIVPYPLQLFPVGCDGWEASLQSTRHPTSAGEATLAPSLRQWSRRFSGKAKRQHVYTRISAILGRTDVTQRSASRHTATRGFIFAKFTQKMTLRVRSSGVLTRPEKVPTSLQCKRFGFKSIPPVPDALAARPRSLRSFSLPYDVE